MSVAHQIGLFDGSQPLKITKPIRLIECFAGYGSQALALKYLGVDFEHWKIAEWAVKSIQAYKDMHFPDDNTDYSEEYSKEWLIDYLLEKGISADYNKPMTREQIARMGEEKIRRVYNNIIATNNLVSVTNVKGADLQITNTDDYTYILTYSFPCQDLSQAGLSKGMAKGSGTRSGLLWEIERILDECEELPQILLMENVPQVIGKKNRDAFCDWFLKLESLGYKSYYTIMNGKDYEIPQNRERCFMVSCLGDYCYDFPPPKPLKLRLKDMLEAKVDEKYYLSDATIERIKNWNTLQEQLKSIEEPIACEIRVDEGIRTFEDNCMGTLRTIDACGCKHIIKPLEPKVLGGIGEKKSNKGTQWYQQDRIYDNNIAISVTTSFNPYYKVKREETRSRVRKLTELECFRLMGVKDEDFERVARNQSNSSLYHLAGDSIITNCLMAIFKDML
jgi:DNA (cytosine-5)-methyltransferase 1